MKILLVGGGSGGPVSPLLAVATELKKQLPKTKFLFIGGKNGPEKDMAEHAGIKFVSINAGKLRRYFSWENLLSPFFVIKGFTEALKILKDYRPDCVFGAGSFIQVPVVLVAWILKIPVILHQQDVIPSLANKICQFFANKITVTFEASLSSFSASFGVLYKKHSGDKIILTGNPFREELLNITKEQALKNLGISKDYPVLLVLGGGTGSDFINNLISDCLPELIKSFQVLHITGKGKSNLQQQQNYLPFEFLTDMASAYAVSDFVISRAGLSTITELSNLKKLSIIIPMPKSHQVINAMLLNELGAAIVLKQEKIRPEGFTRFLKKLLFEREAQEFVKHNIAKIMPKNSAEKIAKEIIKIYESGR